MFSVPSVVKALLLYYITDRQQFPGSEEARCGRLLAKIAEATRAGVDYIQLRERDLTTRELEELARAAMETVHNCRKADLGRPKTKLLVNSRTDVALAAGADGIHLRSSDITVSDARSIYKRVMSARGAVPELTSTHDPCHPERSEGPAVFSLGQVQKQVLRFAQDDKTLASADNERMDHRADDSRPPAHRDGPATCDFLIAASCHTPDETRLAQAQGADFAVFAPVFEKAGMLRPDSGVDALRLACAEAGRMPVLALGGITLQNARACLEAGASGIAGIRLFQDHDIAETALQLHAAGKTPMDTGTGYDE
ncbi:MAG: thiamine phosphate synthase [Terriglobales bacterium]